MWFLLIFLVALMVYAWFLYNQFVTAKARILASIQEIGNQLKRQAELIPNLVNSVKEYMKHEKDIFSELTKARKAVLEVVDKGEAQKMIEVGDRLQTALAPIRALFESTPELQAVGPTTKLMNELRDTADKLMYSRRTLIDLTADYNIKLVTFPANLVAKLFGFQKEAGFKIPTKGAHLEVSSEELKTPKVEL